MREKPEANTYKMCDRCSNILGAYDDQYGCPLIGCRGHLIIVDELMLPIIQELRVKGYRTLFCCSGHLGDPGIYIRFGENYDFGPVPKDFRFEHDTQPVRSGRSYQDGPVCLTLRAIKSKDLGCNIKMQRYILTRMMTLLTWVENLPPLKEV